MSLLGVVLNRFIIQQRSQVNNHLKMITLSSTINRTNFTLINKSISKLLPHTAISAITCKNSLVKMSSTSKLPTASFQEVKSAETNNQALVIDVREPSELTETGTIPGSINIPLCFVETTLKDLPPKHFQASYGKDKPSKDSSIIFTCRSGRRSAEAQQIAAKLGYKKVKNYEGGWLDWEERNKNKNLPS